MNIEKITTELPVNLFYESPADVSFGRSDSYLLSFLMGYFLKILAV